MPTDEHGDKWACEPCIRGHRSTRCEHWDRFMLRVKKPGRPLSSCPHPKTQCSCGNERVMMVRIPKASSCICAPAYSLGSDGLPLGLPSSSGYFSTPLTTYSPSPQPFNPYKIQKHHQRSGSTVDAKAIAMRLQGGQQSNVAIQPQPLGTVDINATRQAKSNNSSTGREGPALIRELSGKNGPNDQASDPLPQQNFMTKDRLLEGGFRNFSNALSAGPKSCCFKSKIDHESQRSAEAIYLNPASLTDDLTRLSSPDSHNDLYPQNSPTQLKNFSLSSHQTDSPQANHQMHSISNQATQYKMSSTSATTSYPSHPGQIADLQQGTDSPAANTRECTQGFRDSEPPPDGSTMFNPAHNCNCGDSCTCLGCAAHPYNNTTKSHVQWLGQILEEGDNDSQLDSPPHSLPGNSPTFIDIHNVFAGSAPPRVGDLPSPPTEVQQFPHFEAINQVDFLPDRHHGELVQPMFPSSGYYTMEFPIELNGSNFGCTDIGGSCQCDSECTCIGCLTHTGHDGDTISLEPASLDEILCESTEPVVATQDLSQDRTSDEPLQSPSYQQRTTLEDSDFA